MRAGDVARLAVVTLAAAASIATPAPQHQYPRNYPVWQVQSGGSWAYGCVTADAWVAKSGKEGIGLVIEFTPTLSAGCTVSIGGGGITGGGKQIHGPGCPYDVKIPLGGRHQVYLPIYFDNEKLWNDGVRRAELELVLTTDGLAAPPWRLDLVHRYDGPHRKVSRGDEAKYLP